jgi:ubiquinone/menaquinone biosynthesis C-methylase UbiE
MGNPEQDINKSYEAFYARRAGARVYPTEFVVRTFLASYPGLKFPKPAPGSRVLDVAFGDGRNTTFLCDQGLDVSGIEITQGIVDQTSARLERLGQKADLRVGRNSSIPFEDGHFDVILACHCCYYCDEGDTFATNMAEYARVLRPGGFLVASVASADSYIFRGATVLPDGSRRIQGDPYGNRDGYRLQAFSDKGDIAQYLAPWYSNFSFGFAGNDYYGVEERVFWVVCQKN